jgi:hypothetical protein
MSLEISGSEALSQLCYWYNSTGFIFSSSAKFSKIYLRTTAFRDLGGRGVSVITHALFYGSFCISVSKVSTIHALSH